MAKENIGVAAVGDVLDIDTWSNIPYYFYTTGHRMGIFNEPWSLDMKAFVGARRIWNLKRMLAGKGTGGYQYSEAFLTRAESQIPSLQFGSLVISFNQLFPRASTIKAAGGTIIYYIDTTLRDLFNEVDYGISIPDSMKNAALDQEKENYEKADTVITMGSWVHESLRTTYDVPENKIGQILPGANIALPPAFKFMPFRAGGGKDRDFVLGFVGKDWKRKGLGILAEVRMELVRRGYRVAIRAIGARPDELKDKPGIEFTGFISKQTNPEEFVTAISTCDLGCLFSTSEALGISTLEFIRVGVPVAGFYHQGLKDTLLDGASIRVQPDSSIAAIADAIEPCLASEHFARKLKQGSERLSGEVTWEKTIEHFRPWLSK